MVGSIKSDEGIDTATHAIPDDQRAGRLSLTMSWWGVCSALFYIFLGATLSMAYGTVNTVIAMVLSVITYGLINSALSRYAITTGLSVALLSRVLFGKVGAAVATAIFALTAIYYAVFEGSVIAIAASNVIDGLGYGIAAILVVVLGVLLVFGSVQHFLDKFNGILLPFYLAGLAAAVIATGMKYGWSTDWLTYVPAGGSPGMGWAHAYIGYMGVWVLMMFTIDFARFGRRKDVKYHRRFNFGIPFYVVTFVFSGLVGIFLVHAGGVATVSETGVVDQLILVLGGIPALIFIFVTQTRINSANFYLATVNLQAFFNRIARLNLAKGTAAVVVGVVTLILMRATDVFAYITEALTYQGIFVTAWVAVALVHIVSGVYERLVGATVHHDRAPAINPAGLAAWFAGAGAGLVMTLADAGTAWAPVVTVLVSAGLYAIALPRARPGWFAIASDAGTVQSTTEVRS